MISLVEYTCLPSNGADIVIVSLLTSLLASLLASLLLELLAYLFYFIKLTSGFIASVQDLQPGTHLHSCLREIVFQPPNNDPSEMRVINKNIVQYNSTIWKHINRQGVKTSNAWILYKSLVNI
ncbi:hypothetical protein YC2023_075914 [Brassica napus]